MSCIKCQEAQESDLSAFYRWKNANIEFRGCDEHLKEIFGMLGKAVKAKQSSDSEIEELTLIFNRYDGLQGDGRGITVVEAKQAITALIQHREREARIDPFDYVQPCEPDCSPERHAYHKGQWDMAGRIAAVSNKESL